MFRAVGFLTTKLDSMRMQYQRAISKYIRIEYVSQTAGNMIEKRCIRVSNSFISRVNSRSKVYSILPYLLVL